MDCEIGRRLAPSFALIVGIDDYTHYPKLSGAVADAKEVQQHFEEDLSVPRDHIITLYDSEATRGAIIEALQKLQTDERIKKGDPIVIFYAGHGGTLTPPPEWRLKKNQIQCLLPRDCEQQTGDEPVRDEYAPIPDRTIGVLIKDMAKAKGDNITVIFDCCHSASGTRDGYVPRSADLQTMIIPGNLDRTIWSGRLAQISPGFAHHGLRSHVLLAACGEQESAYEYERRGQFTSALVKTLRMFAINNSDLTYTEALQRIHLVKQQHPQCEGINRHRILYDTTVPAGRQLWYPARAATDGKGKYIIGAGLSHGVKPGVEFTLYNHKKLLLHVVSSLVDETPALINDFQTTITISVDLENVSHAKLTRVGKVPLYLGNDLVLEETLRKMDGNGSNTANFRAVREVEEAKIQVSTENNQAIFTILDQRVRSLGLKELPHKGDLHRLAYILGAAAHFFWYLDIESKYNNLGVGVAVDFYFLNCDYDRYGNKFFFTVGEGFCRKDQNANSSRSDVIDFVVEPQGRYGIEDFYLNAFLFNNSSLSIAACYTQSSVGNPEKPLTAGGTFEIGYGTGGTPPFSFAFEDGQDVDVGYLKIFFATRPIDLIDIEQMSPFTDNHPPPLTDQRAATQRLPAVDDIWFTVLIPVVQRKKGAAAS
ncbi:caspase domain-containing protein [Boletus edulis BED1]|uniref:Caspase domain-containing protein n=1 Tax=Boletus edulis BED1 TaxID=1328754 RepID=A0AAD4BP82_BOLED|nr:caspase domain-containing protein [Boletus edulis BED1]